MLTHANIFPYEMTRRWEASQLPEGRGLAGDLAPFSKKAFRQCRIAGAATIAGAEAPVSISAVTND